MNNCYDGKMTKPSLGSLGKLITRTTAPLGVATMLLLNSVGFADTVCKNFYPDDGPYYRKDFAPASPANSNDPSQFKFVSYNVNLFKNLKGLQNDFATIQDLRDADFVNFQEASGMIGGPSNFVEPFAKALSMNYVFAPAMTLWGEDYGNAVMSRWPIVSVRKTILPPSGSEKCNHRIAVETIIQVGSRRILVTSIHLSTRFPDSLTGGDKLRVQQFKAGLQSVAEQTEYPAFISGDLNSFVPAGLSGIIDLATQFGFTNARPDPGITYPLFHFDLDHAFARGFTVVESGIISRARGSDHYPIWTVLRLDNQN